MGVILYGCFHAPPPFMEATLIFADLVGPVGGQGEAKVSVAKMPGGLAGLVVGSESGPSAGDWLGLQYDPTQFQVTGVRGLNNFQILAWGTHDTHPTIIPEGEVRFVAINPGEGAVDGDIALIVGNRLGGANFNFQANKVNLQLLDTTGKFIADAAYNVVTGQAPPYYVEGGGS